MKGMDYLLLVFLLVLLFIGGNILLENVSYLSDETQKYEDYVSNVTIDAKSASVAQFYPNMRYQNSTISYTIDDECNSQKRVLIRDALKIISSNTVVVFEEKVEGGEIKYLCSNKAPESDMTQHYVAGEGGPTGIINTTLFSVITSGQVSLYRAEKCDTPQVAIHETLHAMGFDHVKNRKDIMYPITECDQIVSQEMYDALNELYSIKSSPDLGIEYVRANQTGRFLNFFITIPNYGLRDSEEAALLILADGEFIKEFPLGNIKYGTKKFLNVENMKIDGNINMVRFLLRLNGDDLYPENNFAEIYLSYQ